MVNSDSSFSMPNPQPMLDMSRRLYKTKRGLTKSDLAASLGWDDGRVGRITPLFAELAVVFADNGQERDVPVCFPTWVAKNGKALAEPLYVHEAWASDAQKKDFQGRNHQYFQTKARRNAGRAEVKGADRRLSVKMKSDRLGVLLAQTITALEQAKFAGAPKSQIRELKAEYTRIETQIRELATV